MILSQSCMPDKKLIAKKFAASRSSYDEYAKFHELLAVKLVAQTSVDLTKAETVLEIGTHTGTLTRYLRPALNATCQLILSDLQSCSPPRNPGELFLACDGEFLPLYSQCVDVILSSSTFQW